MFGVSCNHIWLDTQVNCLQYRQENPFLMNFFNSSNSRISDTMNDVLVPTFCDEFHLFGGTYPLYYASGSVEFLLVTPFMTNITYFVIKGVCAKWPDCEGAFYQRVWSRESCHHLTIQCNRVLAHLHVPHITLPLQCIQKPYFSSSK